MAPTHRLVTLLAAALVVIGCGGDENDLATPRAPVPWDDSSTTIPAGAPGGAVDAGPPADGGGATAPVADAIAERRATRLRGLPGADPSRPAMIVTPGQDVPNPVILHEDGRYLMYSSQIGYFDPSVALRVSDSITEWTDPPIEVLPVLPAWSHPGSTWAPDVRRLAEDRWVLYMTARLADSDPVHPRQCIGVAVADRPEGPFDPFDEPLVCQLDRLGSIDPRTFVDRDGSLWLHWKSDDNADTEGTTTTTIYAQRLSADGTRLEGEPVRILEVDQPWEGRIVEAPDMVLLEDGYWLFYSGNWFNQPAYAIGVARCEGPAGPCTKPFDEPFLATNEQGAGPGEGSLFVDADGALWMAYSPWAIDFETDTRRPVALARIGLDPVGPYLAAP